MRVVRISDLEVDVVSPRIPKFLSKQTYDINYYAPDEHTLKISAYEILWDRQNPEQAVGTNFRKEFTLELSTHKEADWGLIDWVVCDHFELPDWTNIENIDEWEVYSGETQTLLTDGTDLHNKDLPRRLAEWLDTLPIYKAQLEF